MYRSLVLGLAAVGVCGVSARAATVISTSEPFAGITRYDVTDTSPRVVHYELVQIDTLAAGISFNLTPSNGTATAGEVNSATTLNYINALPAIGTATPAVGINAGYFTSVGSTTANLVSLEVSAGLPVSPWIGGGDGRSSGINVSLTNAVTFFAPASYSAQDYLTNPSSLSLYNAVGGNYMSVRNNVKTGITDDGSALARTAVGVKGQYLYFFTVDNVGGSGSAGLTPVEVGTLLHDTWGLTDVINFDGGGSTQMAMRTPRGTTYVNTPEGTSTRAVAASMVVYANAVPAGVVNSLDGFESGVGHFISTLTTSGSNINVGTTSAESVVTAEHHTGGAAMKLSVAPTAVNWLLRDLSAAAIIAQNVRMTTSGSIGYWLKTTTAGLTTSPGVYDGAGIENGTYRTVIADGQWHLYQWTFADSTQWDSFFNGDGTINNPGVTLDSVMLKGATALAAVVYMDDLSWTNAGTLPVPEPMGVGLIALAAMWRRRR